MWYLYPHLYITASKRKETVKGRGSKSTNHRTYTDLSLTFVFSKRSGLLCWLLEAKLRNSLFGFELQNSPAVDSWRKRRENKILKSPCGKCSFSKNSKIESTCDYWVEAEYWYCVVHLMNGLIIESTNEVILPLMNSLDR